MGVRSDVGYAIGVDLGTQSLRARLLRPDGTLAGEAGAAHGVTYPRPGWAQSDTEDWWAGLVRVVRALLDGHHLAPTDVTSLAFGSQVDGIVIVDAADQVLSPAIIWMDRRSEVEASWLGGRLSTARFRELSGLNVDSTHVAPKLLWLRAHEPRAFGRAARFHLPGSWAVARLTGSVVVDHSNASSTLLYDIGTRGWSDELIRAADLSPPRRPRGGAATGEAGPLTVAAAAALGLSTDCMVAVGCGDEHAAALGAGVIAGGVGAVCDIAGTAEPLAIAATTPALDETGLVETHANADPMSWLIENPGFVSGGSVRWFNDTIARSTYDDLTRLASEVPPGADGVLFLPALSGAMTPRWNGRARGVFHGLSTATGVPQLARAVFEGCAFGVRDIVDRFEAMGLGRGEIRVVGGGSVSPALLQMKADVTGRLVRRVANPEATSVGAAMIAGVMAGTFSNLDEAAAALVRLDPATYEPSSIVGGQYEDAYRAYRALFDAVEPTFDRGVGS